ncbi:DUF1559 domain-containing protein [Rubripirellula lacrimiformis]|nr:DUF1559 domain-containing protein [Rubripirellula lacrimiformis]
MTLTEWLVVIVCVGILLGLLIPFIGRHSPHRRNQCSTNLKNLALASILYENARGKLPGYAMDFGTWTVSAKPSDPSDPDADTSTLDSHRKIGTWAVAVLPWLDAQPTFEHWTDDRYPIVLGGSDAMPLSSGEAGNGFTSLAAVNLAVFQCPSNPRSGEVTHGSNSYICNAGMYHRGANGEAAWQILRGGEQITIDFARSMATANGVFNNKVPAIRTDGRPVAVGPDVLLADFTDGQGNTMLVSENLQAMPWHRAGFINAEDLIITDQASEVRYHESSRYTQGMVWHFEDVDVNEATAVDPVHRINGSPLGENLFNLRMNKLNAADVARPSSAHVEGVYAGFADGATRFIRESIDYQVYQALLTPSGNLSDVPRPEFKLSDDF